MRRQVQSTNSINGHFDRRLDLI